MTAFVALALVPVLRGSRRVSVKSHIVKSGTGVVATRVYHAHVDIRWFGSKPSCACCQYEALSFTPGALGSAKHGDKLLLFPRRRGPRGCKQGGCRDAYSFNGG